MVAKKYPSAGYLLEDGTRVLLLAYADDIAILIKSHTGDAGDYGFTHGIS
jgi:hypothetical protein